MNGCDDEPNGNRPKPAHERRVVIAWEDVGHGVRRGAVDGGWLYLCESRAGGVALCFVPEAPKPEPEPIHDPAKCGVCTPSLWANVPPHRLEG